ncbi:MAG TPA: hypothetical protein VIV11_39810 [Kofleriaceae bacterium]
MCDDVATGAPHAGGMQLAITVGIVTPLRKLYRKLSRELAQSERSALVHTRRESRRLGDVPPAWALRALGAHAHASKPRLDNVIESRQPIGVLAGRKIGELFSLLRHFMFDRLVDTERSYRGTLLGFHHGIAVARLLRDVAERLDERDMVAFCDHWLRERRPLLEAAEREMHWFAEMPKQAMKSGLRIAFQPAPE